MVNGSIKQCQCSTKHEVAIRALADDQKWRPKHWGKPEWVCLWKRFVRPHLSVGTYILTSVIPYLFGLHATTLWVAGYYFCKELLLNVCSFHRYFVTRLTEQTCLKRKLHQRGPTNGSMATKTVRVLSFVSAIGIFLNQIHSMCLWWSYS